MSTLNRNARITTDRFGRSWFLPPPELCPECGQPDNCGDCSHERLSDDDVAMLFGVDRVSSWTPLALEGAR